MNMLPAEQHTFAYENGVIVAGLHEQDGYRRYSLFQNREPLTGGNNLKRVVVDEVDGSASLKL